MKEQKQIFIDEELLQEADYELEKFGLDAQIAVKMLLKRICREKSISFLFTEKPQKQVNFEEEPINKVHRTPVEVEQTCPSINIDNNEDSLNSISRVRVDTEHNNNFITSEDNRMTKNRAIRLFLGNGTQIHRGAVTFASKNRGAYNYWANVAFEFLDADWSLILNDFVHRKLYLFNIPAHSIKRNQLVGRSDRPYLIDLQIMYNDVTFTDNRSRFSFKPYLTESIAY